MGSDWQGYNSSRKRKKNSWLNDSVIHIFIWIRKARSAAPWDVLQLAILPPSFLFSWQTGSIMLFWIGSWITDLYPYLGSHLPRNRKGKMESFNHVGGFDDLNVGNSDGCKTYEHASLCFSTFKSLA